MSLECLRHLDLRVASLQQADGQLDALLEDLVVLGAHDEIREQLRSSFSVQAALNGCHRRPVTLLLGPWQTGSTTVLVQQGPTVI